jgi:hypothetical protein
MDRAYFVAAYWIVVGLGFILFRRAFVRERLNRHRAYARGAIGERTRQRAEARAGWYEMHPAEAERRAIYIGLAFILVGVVVLLVRWNPLGIKSPFTTHASNPRLKTDAKNARLSGFFLHGLAA